MSLLLFFVDGLGIGRRGPANPLDGLGGATPLAVFQDEEAVLELDGKCVPTDACLGIEGRPQSASGQTTILTGVNVPAQFGYHKQGFPNRSMLQIIGAHSIFLRLEAARVGPNAFANAYSERFFETRPRWISATTAAVEAAGMSFRGMDELKAGRAVFHDFTNRALIEKGERIEPRTPEEAATILARLAGEHRFTLYEYFLTDQAGHAQDMNAAREILTGLGALVRALFSRLDLTRTTLLLTSDHGNIEDLSTRNHTRNPVPTLIWGAARERLASRIRTLADIAPAIIDVLAMETTAS